MADQPVEWHQFTDEEKRAIIAEVADGATLSDVAIIMELPRHEVYRLVEVDAAFAREYEVARRVRTLRWEDQILEIAHDARNDWMEKVGRGGREYSAFNAEAVSRSKLRIDTLWKLMGAVAPERYGSKTTTKVDGTMTHTGDVKLDLSVVSDDVLLALERDLNRIEGEGDGSE